MTGRDPLSVRVVLAVFNALLALLPRNYRDRHHRDSLVLMAEVTRDGFRSHGALGAAGSGARAIGDLLVRLPAEYLRFGALGGDLWFAARSMRRYALSTFAAIATLAAGIGLNAAVFTVVDWVLFRPLPYPAAHQLVRVWTAGTSPVTPPADLTYTEAGVLSRARALGSATTFSVATRVLAADRVDAFHANVARLGGDWFGTFAIQPDIGRGIDAREIAAGAPVAVISHTAWRQRFFADPSIVGRIVTEDRRALTIVGVMPPGRGYPAGADVWRPATAAEREDDDRENVMIGRLAATQTADGASLELATLVQASSRRRAWADDLQRAQAGSVRTALLLLWASAGLVLLMACSNVAALIGARGADRARELAVRAAVGASRARLVQQLVTESILLAAAGGVAGLLLGRWVLDAIVALAPAGLPRAADISLDARIVAVGVVATLAVGVVVGAATAARSSRLDFSAAFAATGGRSSRPSRGRHLLVGAQTAIAIVLTVMAILFARALQRLVRVDHGLAADRLITVEVNLRNAPSTNAAALFDRLIESAVATPGVHSAAFALRPPHQVPGPRVAVREEGSPEQSRAIATLRPVSNDYFATAGIRLTEGRTFDGRDTRGAPRTAIVNGAFARTVLQRPQVVGSRLATDAFEAPVTIVGTVADVTPGGEVDRPALYVSTDQVSIGGGSLVVRTDGDPRALVQALAARLRATAPALALDRIQRVSQALESGRAAVRFNTQLASAFAALALLLAVVSVYGLTAGEVVARWRELAIRLALGARQAEAWWTVVGPGARAVAVGAVAGGAAAAALSRWAGSRIDSLTTADLTMLIAVSAALMVVGLAAASFASVRVLRADPAATLRRD